ncbi:MAG: hypothetical protein ACMUJM_16795 [bacterium]
MGKAIIVKSIDPNDINVVTRTVIDGGQGDRVVMFHHDEGSNAVLSGFTVQNGIGGISCSFSSPTITN